MATKAKAKAVATRMINQRISIPVNFIRAYTWDKNKYSARQMTPKGGIRKKDSSAIVRRAVWGIVMSKQGLRGYFKRKGKIFSALYNEDTKTWHADKAYNVKDGKAILTKHAA